MSRAFWHDSWLFFFFFFVSNGPAIFREAVESAYRSVMNTCRTYYTRSYDVFIDTQVCFFSSKIIWVMPFWRGLKKRCGD